MFRPSGGHRQVVHSEVELIQYVILHSVLILLQSEQPDDGQLKAETCSCQ